ISRCGLATLASRSRPPHRHLRRTGRAKLANYRATHALPLQVTACTCSPGGSRMHMPTSQEVKEAFAKIDGNVSLLPPAPTLPPVIEGATENDPASAEANDVRLSAETKILTTVIEKIPEGCLLTFSAGELGVLFSEPWRKRRTNRWYGVSRAEPV